MTNLFQDRQTTFPDPTDIHALNQKVIEVDISPKPSLSQISATSVVHDSTVKSQSHLNQTQIFETYLDNFNPLSNTVHNQSEKKLNSLNKVIEDAYLGDSSVILVNGPTGCGKSKFIKQYSYYNTKNFPTALQMSRFLNEHQESSVVNMIDKLFDQINDSVNQKKLGLGRLLLRTQDTKKKIIHIQGYIWELKFQDKNITYFLEKLSNYLSINNFVFIIETNYKDNIFNFIKSQQTEVFGSKVKVFEFQNISNLNMIKILNESISNLKLDNILTPDDISYISSESQSDVRFAFNTIMLFCNYRNNVSTTSKLTNIQGNRFALKDESISFQHFLGRFLYNKRTDPRTGKTRQMNRTEMTNKQGAMYFEPLDELNMQNYQTNDKIVEWLFQNQLIFHADVNDLSASAEYFSDQDAFTNCDCWFKAKQKQNPSEDLEHNGILSLAYSLLYNNQEPTNPGKQTMQRPAQIDRKEQSAKVRTEQNAYFESSLYLSDTDKAEFMSIISNDAWMM